MKTKNELILKGLPISEGITIGKPYLFLKDENPIPDFDISKEDVQSEIIRYREAIIRSENDLKKLQSSLKDDDSYEILDILGSHLEILQDPFITSEIEKRICSECRNSESIFQDSIIKFKAKFKNIDDSFFQERVRDIIDVSRRILHHLRNENSLSAKKIPVQSIVISSELVPSDIAEISVGQVSGFVTQRGGATSHSAIIARAKEIPYVAGIDISCFKEENIETIIVDGSKGKVIANPTKERLDYYQKLIQDKRGFYQNLKESSVRKTETKDGFSINLFGNIDSIDEVDLVLKHNAAGVGLFRSEYLFLANNSFPTEDVQFKIYKKLVEKLSSLPLVVRIFDVGGDKSIKNHDEILKEWKNELNPVLGCRAIRFLMKNPKYLKTQLRAILRASELSKIGILVPMVSDISELFFVKEAIDSVKAEILNEGVHFKENISLGCMIEVPSSAIMSDEIAKHADFLSIGTNDLIQYVLAADRTNPQVSDIYSLLHPSILRLIVGVVKSAQKYNKPLILCGEAAADPKLIPILIGLGIKEFSVSAQHVPIINYTIQNICLSNAVKLAKKALELTSFKSLKELVESQSNLD